MVGLAANSALKDECKGLIGSRLIIGLINGRTNYVFALPLSSIECEYNGNACSGFYREIVDLK